MIAPVARYTKVSSTQSNEQSSNVDVRFAANGFLMIDSIYCKPLDEKKWDIGTFTPSRHNLTLKEWSKVKSDTPKICSIKVDCTLQTSKTNNKQDRDTFVKNVNAGDGNGSKSKTTNESTVTKITHRMSPKLMKLSWEFEKSGHTHTHPPKTLFSSNLL